MWAAENKGRDKNQITLGTAGGLFWPVGVPGLLRCFAPVVSSSTLGSALV